MSKNLLGKYYQGNEERLLKKLVKDIKFFLIKKKEKSNNMDMNVIKIFQKMKNKKLFEYRRKYCRMKTLYNNSKKLFYFRAWQVTP